MSSRFYTHPHKLSVYTIYDYVADYLITNKIKLDSKFSDKKLNKEIQIAKSHYFYCGYKSPDNINIVKARKHIKKLINKNEM
tara:strand:+ start:940 stop:1185 length:246 start_codon:yes stop_codon:yes gene_type:complete